MKIDPSVENYLKRKKWSYDDRNPSQFVVKTCPYCGDRGNHFYINKETGQYLCWKCDHEGNLYSLKKDLGDLGKVEKVITRDDGDKMEMSKDDYTELGRKIRGWHNALKANEEYRKILLKKWGYGKVAIERFNLGLQKKADRYWLTIPQYENEKLANVKFRSLPPMPKRFRRIEGMKSVLFNRDRVDPAKNFIFLLEGESDAITADVLGIENAVGVTVGARGFKEEWIDYLEQFEKIYLCYDPDISGQKGAEKMAGRLGIHRCYNIELPTVKGEDKTDLTVWIKSGNDLDDFKNLVAKSKPFDVRDVSSFRSVLDDLEAELYFHKRLDHGSFMTPWENVNKLVGGMVPGDLIVLSGPGKIGKSAWALNVLLDLASKGVPVLDYCLEMRKERIGTRIVQYLRCVTREEISRDDITVVKATFGRKPFYLAHSYQFTLDQVFDTIRDAVKRYGIEFMVFDHLHFLIRSLDNTTAEVGAAVRGFKLLAEELRIPIMLICQPRKVKSKHARVTTEDLRDSSAIGQDADTVIILHRARIDDDKAPEGGDEPIAESKEPVFSPWTQVIIDATRYNPGGITKLYYNGGYSRFFIDQEHERRFLHGDRS
jgi:hypothetical protein